MKAFLIAGEVSGDKLGAALMRGLKKRKADLKFDGIAGPLMQAEGMESLFPMDELSLMGIAEILPKYRHLKRRIAQSAQAVIEAKPDVLITIDSPDFCLRVAKLVKAQSDIKTIHYVAPTVWAWRAGRAEKMAHHIDHVLALFPFEPPYMHAAGIGCDFVGHPVVSEPVATENDAHEFRNAHEIGDAPLVLVLPGSRRGEVSRLTPIFEETLQPVLAVQPKARIVIPAARPVVALVKEQTSDWPIKPIILDGRDAEAVQVKHAAFKAADVALAASGTVSLELAAADTPMIIAYDMSWLSRQIIGRMLKVDTVTLVNLVSETRTVPEFIGADCDPLKIGPAVVDVLKNPTAQQEAMRLTMERLGKGNEDPGLRAADAVLRAL